MKKVKDDPKGRILLGLAHAYNSLKHNMKFYVLHNKEEGFSFNNIDFNNFTFRRYRLFWIKTENVLDEAWFIDNKIKYEKYIEGKEVTDTFNDTLVFLNTEAMNILFENK
jgi:hypothetical protein